MILDLRPLKRCTNVRFVGYYISIFLKNQAILKKILQYYPQIYVKVHKNGQFQKKCLHLTEKGDIIHFVVLCLDLSEKL